MSRAWILVILTIGIVNVCGQFNYDIYRVKPGSCPPRLPVERCTLLCSIDEDCEGSEKCCPTSCGGSICSIPVTMRKQENIQKIGICPNERTGRWVCASTCSADSDCRGTKKCCKNRCGAFACRKPDVEVIESIEIPFGVQPAIPYNVGPNGNPFLVDSN